MSESKQPDKILICGRDAANPLGDTEQRRLRQQLNDGGVEAVISGSPIDIFQRVDGRWEYIGPKTGEAVKTDDPGPLKESIHGGCYEF